MNSNGPSAERRKEIVEHRLPAHAYQVLGITGYACLVIPEYEAVVVRMYNQLGNVGDYELFGGYPTVWKFGERSS